MSCCFALYGLVGYAEHESPQKIYTL
jgi:hypothetical protein